MLYNENYFKMYVQFYCTIKLFLVYHFISDMLVTNGFFSK
jgi:hypothetical protein